MCKLFKKKPKTVIRGLTAAEVMYMHDEIVEELEEAKARQSKPDAQPNMYMKGLLKALDILDGFEIHTIAEVR